jgi:Fe2+ or Zn2+ uptake regulation protein
MTTAVVPGVPPGLVEAVVSILEKSPTPVRRRILLEELDRRGHRTSLAGLNRTLQQCQNAGLTIESGDGVRLAPRSDTSRNAVRLSSL